MNRSTPTVSLRSSSETRSRNSTSLAMRLSSSRRYAIRTLCSCEGHSVMMSCLQVEQAVPKEPSNNLWHTGQDPEELGIINQKGLNRKVRIALVT